VQRPIRVLELRSVRGTGGGPEKTILMGAARTDPRRFAVTVCYIRDARDSVFLVAARAAKLDVNYVELRERHSLDPSIWPALRRLVRSRNIDIVHSHDYKTDLLAWLLAKIDGVAALSTAHGWTGHTRRERVYYYFDKRLLARFDHAIAVSGDIRSRLIRAGARPERVSVILNGIDPQVFRRDRSQESRWRGRFGFSEADTVIGAVGRLEPQKRFDLLISAVAKLRQRHPQLRLLIAGDGSLRGKLLDQIERLNLHDACRLVGHTSDVSGLHHAFDLFAQASTYEGTPNAVLEAMALETPVVATDAGGTMDLVRPDVDGLIVPAGSLAALENALEEALNDRRRSADRARSARRRIERDLSFDARMAAVEAIYEELVRSRRPAGAAAAVPA
jgi:glycosyltransferase involved in cell wall biosynthesis